MGNGRVEDHWRDTDVRVEGPASSTCRARSPRTGSRRRASCSAGDAYFPAPRRAGESYAQVVRSSPAGGSFAMYTTFLLAISARPAIIYITNPYFVPDGTMEDALLGRRAGRPGRVLVPGPIDHNLVRQASRGSSASC